MAAGVPACRLRTQPRPANNPALPSSNRVTEHMLRWFGDRDPTRTSALQLYGSSVAQARRPVFYRDWRVADTFSGRFELVMLHVGLLMRRLTAEGAPAHGLGQALVEQMFAALDDDMRAIGIGDLTVPKKIQAAASSFYGRLKAYDSALKAADDGELAGALERNVPAHDGDALQSGQLAAYVHKAAERLGDQAFAELNKGRVIYPDLTEVQP
jgi:cytochrome b pre-mRNA-processing protein 3